MYEYNLQDAGFYEGIVNVVSAKGLPTTLMITKKHFTPTIVFLRDLVEHLLCVCIVCTMWHRDDTAENDLK